ncbi:MAG: hypothetical protein EOO38_12855 [Cytophagaceae bacterium]|nr:MAG: hypothetical protein EOO38_12855 [Cytophagaceae bacterium]
MVSQIAAVFGNRVRTQPVRTASGAHVTLLDARLGDTLCPPLTAQASMNVQPADAKKYAAASLTQLLMIGLKQTSFGQHFDNAPRYRQTKENNLH